MYLLKINNSARGALIFLFFSSMILGFSGCMDRGSGSLEVTDMDVSADRVTSSFVRINVTTYLENDGPASTKNVSMLLKAYDTDTGLLSTEIRRHIGDVGKDKTIPVSQALNLPKEGSYDIEAIFFVDEVEEIRRGKILHYLGSLPVDIKTTGIEISEMDFMAKGVDEGKAVIRSDIYFTNEGPDESPSYSILVKAREMNAGLIADKKWARLDPIQSETTTIKMVNLTVPDRYNYAIEVQIWNNDTIVQKGEGSVLLSPEATLSSGQSIQSRRMKTADFAEEEAAEYAAEEAPETSVEDRYYYESTEEAGSGMPGFAAPSAIMALLAAGLLMRGRRR